MVAIAKFQEPVKTMVWAMDEVSKESETKKEQYFDEYFEDGIFYTVIGEKQRVMFLVGKLAAAGHDGLVEYRLEKY